MKKISIFALLFMIFSISYLHNSSNASGCAPSLISASSNVLPTFKFTPAESGQDDFNIQVLQNGNVVRDFNFHCDEPVNTGYTMNPFIVGQSQLSGSTSYTWKCRAIEGTCQNFSSEMGFTTQ